MSLSGVQWLASGPTARSDCSQLFVAFMKVSALGGLCFRCHFAINGEAWTSRMIKIGEVPGQLEPHAVAHLKSYADGATVLQQRTGDGHLLHFGEIWAGWWLNGMLRPHFVADSFGFFFGAVACSEGAAIVDFLRPMIFVMHGGDGQD